MAGRIPEEAIREVRERASLTEVVSDAVTLRRSGRGAVGLCPFHTEKTPSFSVSEDRGFYHCFGCGEHGDVFTFVMKTQGLAFPEAVERVAARFGVVLPEVAGERRRPVEPLAAANAAAAAFYAHELAAPGGVRARAYLEGRGLREETVRRFRIGYAPPGPDALLRHLRSRAVPTEAALTAGLVVRSERSGMIDRFRDRVVFPISDGFGRVIAFGGRLLSDDVGGAAAGPKYLNSPDSPLFRKGHTLYGLAEARDAIRRTGRAVVVEGYFDAIALAQAGVQEVVAPLGTALTVEQLRVVRRLTDLVIACFDGDQAGRRAAARSFPAFLEAGLWGRGAFLPTGEDPDSFVRGRGREALDACLEAAEPLIEAYLEEIGGPTRDAVGRHAAAAREIAQVLKRLRSPIEFGLLAHRAAERLGVREEILREEGMAPSSQAVAPPPAGRGSGPREEELLVELMAADPEVASRVRAAEIIHVFQHPTWRQAAVDLVGAGERERTEIVQGLPRELRDRVARRLLGEVEDEDRERAVADCIARIRERRHREVRAGLLEELRAAQSRGDAAAVEAAMRRLQDLRVTEHTEKVRT
jgi:DNA primase